MERGTDNENPVFAPQANERENHPEEKDTVHSLQVVFLESSFRNAANAGVIGQPGYGPRHSQGRRTHDTQDGLPRSRPPGWKGNVP